MVVSDAVIHGKREYLIGFHECEHPVALQIGGSDPVKLAEAARIGAGFGYDEINLNVGCPSDRVQSGRFGACLMAEPELVADCYRAMSEAVDIPVSIKCRIGIDEQNPLEALPHFLQIVSAAGCRHFIIHARKAILGGLSPKDNRKIPPLNYDLVRAMKQKFPYLQIVLNGGLDTLDQALEEGAGLDGVMFGRAAYHRPWMLSRVDSEIFGDTAPQFSREDIVEKLIEYAQSVEDTDPSVKALTRHIMGLYHAEPGARAWRQALSAAAPGVLTSVRIIAAKTTLSKAQGKAA